MTVATSVKLSDETGRKLEQLAAATGRSKSYYLREAVETHIDRLLYEYGMVQRVEDVRAGREATYGLDEVEADLGLDR